MSKENDIIQIVCRSFDVEPDQVVSTTRKGNICEARKIAMYFIRQYSSCSFQYIGQIFGRTTTPVVLACKRVEELCEVDARYRTRIDEIDSLIKKARNMVMVASEEFNRGFWCAVQEMSAQGVSDSIIIDIIISAGFTYDECIELMDDSDYGRERLEQIVEYIFEGE
jgi:hypothetical protein